MSLQKWIPERLQEFRCHLAGELTHRGHSEKVRVDLITHGLAGALVAQAGFAQRIGRPAMIALVAGGMLPDVDVVMAWVDELSVMRYHRGLTHSFVGAFLPAL